MSGGKVQTQHHGTQHTPQVVVLPEPTRMRSCTRPVIARGNFGWKPTRTSWVAGPQYPIAGQPCPSSRCTTRSCSRQGMSASRGALELTATAQRSSSSSVIADRRLPQCQTTPGFKVAQVKCSSFSCKPAGTELAMTLARQPRFRQTSVSHTWAVCMPGRYTSTEVADTGCSSPTCNGCNRVVAATIGGRSIW